MDKIKIKGLGNLILKGDKPEPEKEYIIAIKAELESINKDIQDKDNPAYTYNLRYLSTEQIMETGSRKKIIVENGKTWSQKLRWSLETLASKKGLDTQEFYEQEMKKLIAQTLKEIDKD